MHYWIDGYNLLFYLPKERLSKSSFEDKRRALILEINRQALDLSLTITIVFDASDPMATYDSKSHYKSLEIIYTHPRKTADEAILEAVRLHKRPQELCVVTSDKDLSSKALYLGAITLSLPEFLHFLSKKQHVKTRKNHNSDLEFKESAQEFERLLKLFSREIPPNSL